MVTDIAPEPLREEQKEMLHVLVKRMLTETDPERLQMFTEQIGRIAREAERTARAA